MKRIIRNIIKAFGYEIIKNQEISFPSSSSRPVGRIDYFLEDIKKRGLNCKSVFDVGANNGDWSRMAKKIFPDAKFYLIEPQEEMLDHLKNFCAEHNDSEYFLAGAGSKDETRIFTIWNDFTGSSFLPAENEEFLKSGKQRRIKIMTIDEIIRNSHIDPPEIIKLDIQGFELEALRGAERTFGYTEIYIIEVSLFPFDDVPGVPLFSDIINFMLKRDYVVYDFAGFMRRPVDGALGQCDLCFVKQTGFLRKILSWN